MLVSAIAGVTAVSVTSALGLNAYINGWEHTKKAINSAAKYLYHGVFNGALVTGGFPLFALFMLHWTMSPFWIAVFAVATALTTVAGVYLVYYDNRRDDHSKAMNPQAAEIKRLISEIQYYKEKLIEEKQSLHFSSTANNPIHRTIKEADRERIQDAISRLRLLVNGGHTDDGDVVGLKTRRDVAQQFSERVNQRYTIAAYKSVVAGYVFYGSFPLFAILIPNAIIAPITSVPVVLGVLVYSGLATLFGTLKTFIDKTAEIQKFDAALAEAKWIEDTALSVASNCEKHNNANIAKIALHEGNNTLHRIQGDKVRAADIEQRKDAGYIYVKEGDELRKRIPSLQQLVKPLGDRVPPTALPARDWLSNFLLKVANYLYLHPILNNTINTIGEYLDVAIKGAIIPGGVVLFLKFIMGMTLTPPMVTAFFYSMVSCAAISMAINFYNNRRDSRIHKVEKLTDAFTALTTEVQYILQKLKKEYGLVKWQGNQQHPFHRRISDEDRAHVKDVVAQLKDTKLQLSEAAAKVDRFHNNLFIWAFNRFTIAFNSVRDGYSWYAGFPWFVFLTYGAVIAPITLPWLIETTFWFGLLAGTFGLVRSLIQEVDNASNFVKVGVDAAKLVDAGDELARHCDKYLEGTYNQLSNAKFLESLEGANPSQYHAVNGDKQWIKIKQGDALESSFELLKALRGPEPAVTGKASKLGDDIEREDALLLSNVIF